MLLNIQRIVGKIRNGLKESKHNSDLITILGSNHEESYYYSKNSISKQEEKDIKAFAKGLDLSKIYNELYSSILQFRGVDIEVNFDDFRKPMSFELKIEDMFWFAFKLFKKTNSIELYHRKVEKGSILNGSEVLHLGLIISKVIADRQFFETSNIYLYTGQYDVAVRAMRNGFTIVAQEGKFKSEGLERLKNKDEYYIEEGETWTLHGKNIKKGIISKKTGEMIRFRMMKRI